MIITRALTCRVASASLPGYARSPLHSHPVGGKLLPDSLSENKSMTAITNQLFRIGAVKYEETDRTRNATKKATAAE
jgi:hypothetical protein|tara:strand:- start:1561 stop:1791 length:231 start_codon:yes stop_codon:yes gene_type:complete